MGSGNDIQAAREAYAGFTALMKWGAISSAVVIAVVIFLIA